MSEVKVNKISPRSGTDVTLGDASDTFTVPTGVGLTLTDSTLLLPTTINTDKLDPKSGTALEIGTSGDTITVPTGAGLTVTDEVKTNKISPATGVAFALGDSGDTFTIPSGATISNLGTATGFGGDNTPAFEAKKTDGNQSISNATDTKVTFNAENFDTDSAFASDKFTVPAGEGGKYFFYTSIAWNNDDRGLRLVYFFKNGSEIKRMYEVHPASDDAAFASTGALLELVATDYVEIYVNQTTGDPENVISNGEMTYFGGFKLL